MPETLGQYLKQARADLRITLDKASEATRIRVPYLQALESDDYSIIPSAAQGRGFLRNYAEYLGLDLDQTLAELQRNRPEPDEISGPLPQADIIQTDILQEKKPRPSWNRRLARRAPAESTPEADSPQPPAEEPEPIKPRVRKKKDPASLETPRKSRKKTKKEEPAPIVEEPRTAEQIKAASESQPVEAAQPPVMRAAKPNPFAKFLTFIKIRLAASRPASEISADVEVQTQAPDVPNETAEEIFIAIGVDLQKRRELISLTLDEVERHIHVRAAFLKLLEEGVFDELPSPVQTRGMIANYAAFLDLDVDAILLRFADALQARRRQKYPKMPRGKNSISLMPSMPPLRSFIAGDLIFGIAMVVMLAALAIWGVSRVIAAQRAQAALPTALSIPDVLVASPALTPVQEVTFIPIVNTPFVLTGTPDTTGETPTPAVNINVTVIVTAVERSYLRVSVDGKIIFDGRVIPGDVFTYEAENQVSILTGNGSALRVTFNGRDLGLIGNFGEVVSQIYTIDGLVTPTATISPTPTITPKATITSTSTNTPISTPTPTP